jgi:hypothetical protein
MHLVNEIFAALFIGSFVALVSLIYCYGLKHDKE